MANELIERVAHSILTEARRQDIHCDERDLDAIAAAAVGAMRDPDMAMISAAVARAEQSGPTDFVGIWTAMIDAALGWISGEGE